MQPATKCRQPRFVHGDDWQTFDPGSLEAVCEECSRSAAAEDHAAYRRDVDADGYPVDPRHPALRQAPMTCLFYAGLIFAAFVGATIERKLNGKHHRKCTWDRRG